MFRRKKKKDIEEVEQPSREEVRSRHKHKLTPDELQRLGEVNQMLDEQREKQEQRLNAINSILPGVEFNKKEKVVKKEKVEKKSRKKKDLSDI